MPASAENLPAGGCSFHSIEPIMRMRRMKKNKEKMGYEVESLSKEVVSRIEELARAENILPARLAERSGLADSTLSRWTSGAREISLNSVCERFSHFSSYISQFFPRPRCCQGRDDPDGGAGASQKSGPGLR